MSLFTHKVTQGYVGSTTITSVVTSYTGDVQLELDDNVNATTTNKEFDIAITVANIKSIVITCDKAVTVKTNSTGSPQETITLTAGQAVIWAFDHLEASPFLGNVTKMYVTNAGAAVARFRVSVLLNQGV